MGFKNIYYLFIFLRGIQLSIIGFFYFNKNFTYQGGKMRQIDYFKETLYNTSKGFVSLAFADEKSWTEYIYRIKEFGKFRFGFQEFLNADVISSLDFILLDSSRI